MKIRAWADYGWVNTYREFVIEVDDNATIFYMVITIQLLWVVLVKVQVFL